MLTDHLDSWSLTELSSWRRDALEAPSSEHSRQASGATATAGAESAPAAEARASAARLVRQRQADMRRRLARPE